MAELTNSPLSQGSHGTNSVGPFPRVGITEQQNGMFVAGLPNPLNLIAAALQEGECEFFSMRGSIQSSLAWVIFATVFH